MDPSSGFDASSDYKSELKNQELVVGAPRFELGTSCAQGRRATRLRYAPTRSNNLMLLYLYVLLQVLMMTVSLALCQIAANRNIGPKFAGPQIIERKGKGSAGQVAHLARKAGAFFSLRIPSAP
jgi:hypothetical protein